MNDDANDHADLIDPSHQLPETADHGEKANNTVVPGKESESYPAGTAATSFNTLDLLEDVPGHKRAKREGGEEGSGS